MKRTRGQLLFLALLGVVSVAHGQDAWPVDSLLTTWPVQQRMAEHRAKTHVGAGLAGTAAIHTTLRRSAPALPVFADSLVERYAEVFSGERREHFRVVLGKAREYEPLIERELARHGMPSELAHLPLALSAMNPQATTDDGRAGLWLLSWPAAIRQGLVVDGRVDERRDPVKSTVAAMRELQDLHGHFGDWPTTVMAFVCGPANLVRARRHSPDPMDPRLLYRHMAPAQRSVLPRLMAFTWLALEADRLDLSPLVFRVPEANDTLRCDSTLSIAALTKVMGTRPSRFRALNPVLIGGIVPAGAPFLLPRSEAARFNDLLFVVLEAQRSKPRGPVATTPEPERSDRLADGREAILYRITEGDRVESIAGRFGVEPAEVRGWNELTTADLEVGNTLLLYVAPAERMRFEADTTGLVNAPIPPPALRPKSNGGGKAPAPEGFTWYTVRSGDSLYLIAKRHPGISSDDIMRFNGIGANIRPGQRLKIPTR